MAYSAACAFLFADFNCQAQQSVVQGLQGLQIPCAEMFSALIIGDVKELCDQSR